MELSCSLAPGHRGRGNATEAVQAPAPFARDGGRARVVCAPTRPENGASGCVLERNGFAWVGEVTDPEEGRVWRWEKAGREGFDRPG